jgi:hypothetical protein
VSSSRSVWEEMEVVNAEVQTWNVGGDVDLWMERRCRSTFLLAESGGASFDEHLAHLKTQHHEMEITAKNARELLTSADNEDPWLLDQRHKDFILLEGTISRLFAWVDEDMFQLTRGREIWMEELAEQRFTWQEMSRA